MTRHHRSSPTPACLCFRHGLEFSSWQKKYQFFILQHFYRVLKDIWKWSALFMSFLDRCCGHMLVLELWNGSVYSVQFLLWFHMLCFLKTFVASPEFWNTWAIQITYPANCNAFQFSFLQVFFFLLKTLYYAQLVCWSIFSPYTICKDLLV